MPRPVIVPHRAPMPIGAALGREGFDRLGHRRAQLAQHRLQHMVAPDQQAVRLDLAGRVAVADMPGEAREVARDDENRLFGRRDLDQPAIVKNETIARVHADRFRQIEQERRPAIRRSRLRRRKRAS